MSGSQQSGLSDSTTQTDDPGLRIISPALSAVQGAGESLPLTCTTLKASAHQKPFTAKPSMEPVGQQHHGRVDDQG